MRDGLTPKPRPHSLQQWRTFESEMLNLKKTWPSFPEITGESSAMQRLAAGGFAWSLVGKQAQLNF